MVHENQQLTPVGVVNTHTDRVRHFVYAQIKVVGDAFDIGLEWRVLAIEGRRREETDLCKSGLIRRLLLYRHKIGREVRRGL